MGETERDALILNVNDNLAARYMVTRMLRGAGLRVIEAGDGARALELARSSPQPDVVVLDVKLPDIDGLEVCRLLKASPETAAIKILHTSAAFITAERKVQGLEVGADGYLTQPFEPQELIATVRSLLRLRRAELELRERAERLADADRRKDEFLAMLGHELRNPLAAITSAMPLLASREARNALETRARDVIGRQTKQLARLVDDLLEVARVTRGAIELRIERLDLRALLERLVASVRDTHPRGRERHIVVEPSPGGSEDAGPVWVDGDAARLEQIFTNLVDNAIKHTAVGGHITIRLTRSAPREGAAESRGEVEISFRDDGIGIDAEAVPKLFATFYQVSPGIARSQGGLGLGLALVKRLAELHGGQVSARSEGLGHGSEFVVRLPLAVGNPVVSTPPPLAVLDHGLRILVVEDNVDAGETLRDLLVLWGHRADLVGDGEAGLAACLAGDHDLALIDVGLPGIDGFELARRVRASTSGRPLTLVALTGYGAPEDTERAKLAGFDRHVVKPIDADALRALIERVARREPAAGR